MKKIIICLYIFLFISPLTIKAAKKINPESLKMITGQAGTIEPQSKDINSVYSPTEIDSSLTTHSYSKQKDLTSNIVHRGAGISIFINNIVIQITHIPDITYWDTDGVK